MATGRKTKTLTPPPKKTIVESGSREVGSVYVQYILAWLGRGIRQWGWWIGSQTESDIVRLLGDWVGWLAQNGMCNRVGQQQKDVIPIPNSSFIFLIPLPQR